MMETQSQGAGYFANFDLTRVPSPCFVVDEVKLAENLQLLADIKTRANVKILAALKAFSFWHLAPLMNQYLDGVCASGLWEAQLGHQHYGGIVETFSPAYKASEIETIADLSDHLVFNSPSQIERFGAVARTYGAALGCASTRCIQNLTLQPMTLARQVRA